MKEHVAIIIRDKENKILFIQRSLDKKTLPGAWSFPSGTVEEGEEAYTTFIRESEEELGIESIQKESSPLKTSQNSQYV